MRLLLVRHGQTMSNVGHHLDTADPGAELTELGWRQANAVPGALAGEPVQAVYVSTLIRTQQTAAPLAQHRRLRPRVRPGIREIAAGHLEMRNDHEAIEQYVQTVFVWDAEPDRRVPGGETGPEVLNRFDAVAREAADEGLETVVFVSHGAMIRVWTACRADNVDMEFALTHWLPNTGLVVVEGHPSTGWTMRSWQEQPLGGLELNDPQHTGPAGEPEDTWTTGTDDDGPGE